MSEGTAIDLSTARGYTEPGWEEKHSLSYFQEFLGLVWGAGGEQSVGDTRAGAW